MISSVVFDMPCVVLAIVFPTGRGDMLMAG